MEEAGASLVFREEWVEQVRNIFVNENSLANADKIPRVAALLYAKPEAYIPHFVSMGPYHHWTLEKKIAAPSSAGDSYEYHDLRMSTVEEYKVQSAATFWQNRSENLDGIVRSIKDKQQKIEAFYDWKISRGGEYPEHFALMMAIDSSFLLRFLLSQSGPSDDGMKRFEVPVKCDILKLENQIPLSVLTSVLDFANKALNIEERFSGLLQKMYNLSPFYQFDRENTDDQSQSIQIAETQINDQQHLLGCLHAFVSQLMQIKVIEKNDYSKPTRFQRLMHFLEPIVGAVFTILQVKHPYKEGRRDILKSYNAGELEKAGIKFKSFRKQSEQIRFDKCSGTLYLPQITVSEVQTEVFFRNMLALEFNAALRDSATRNVGDSVTRYVRMMDCFIDTAEDVRLLRESQVILRGGLMLTDEKIAGMWNGMCHPIFTGHLEPLEDLKKALKEVLIRKYYMSILNKILWEFWLDHLSNPGKGVALLVGGLILLMTIIQTGCTILQTLKDYSPR